ncbi:hypothetical protein AB0B28_08225 [Glycomyces sp. NPDC046736]|uniref:hypothetical protein n=1 Tax=Glycomyces sp. NPDC046736 TaxID=3155615 RepID=UPI003410EC6E
MSTRFTPADVLEYAVAADGDYDDGLNAHVSARIVDAAHAIVELTSVETDGRTLAPEKFQVTVERIGADQ